MEANFAKYASRELTGHKKKVIASQSNQQIDSEVYVPDLLTSMEPQRQAAGNR